MSTTLSIGIAVACAVILGNSATLLAESPVPWVAPAAAAAKKNPLAGKPDASAAGKQVFTTTCVPCHGPGGHGDGAAAAALNPRPANFSSPAITGESDGALFWKLSEGRGAMVAFKASLSETQRWQLITYIRSLEGKK
jgi:mono/diheme cytochrome c family protein